MAVGLSIKRSQLEIAAQELPSIVQRRRQPDFRELVAVPLVVGDGKYAILAIGFGYWDADADPLRVARDVEQTLLRYNIGGAIISAKNRAELSGYAAQQAFDCVVYHASIGKNEEGFCRDTVMFNASASQLPVPAFLRAELLDGYNTLRSYAPEFKQQVRNEFDSMLVGILQKRQDT